MDYWSICLLFISLLGTILRTGGVELSFELPDNAKQCFYQDIEKNATALFEFQVYINIILLNEIFLYIYNIIAQL